MLKNFSNGPIIALFLFLLLIAVAIENVSADSCTCYLYNRNTHIKSWAYTPFGCALWASQQNDKSLSNCCCWVSAPKECWDGFGRSCIPNETKTPSGPPIQPDPKETAGKDVPPGHMTDPNPISLQEYPKQFLNM